jgi:phosphoribosyl 1,2-cyclic phosphate phosphodiesterase
LRPIPKYLGNAVPLYCTLEVERKIRQAFAYAFVGETEAVAAGYVPKLCFHRITSEPFSALGQRIVPIPLVHAHFDVFGFRIDDVAYCTRFRSRAGRCSRGCASWCWTRCGTSRTPAISA